jgi:hypothetical protein
MVLEKGGWSIGQAGLDVTFPQWVAGRYYGSTPTLSLGTINTHEQMIAVPIYFPGPNGAAIDELGLELSLTGTSDGLIRLGIYDDLEGQPWDLILDAGTIDTAHTGWLHVDVSQRLRGWAWLAACFDDYTTPPTYRTSSTGPLSILGFSRPEGTTIVAGYSVDASRANVQAGLPARFPLNIAVSILPGVEYNLPRLLVRAA